MEYTDEDAISVDGVVADAVELLSTRFGGTPVLSDPEVLSGQSDALVVRMRVASNPFMQERSVVVKQIPKTADGVDPAVLREVVAYQFVNALPDDVRPGPPLLAYDVSKQLLVLGDVGESETMADVLVSGDEERRLRAYRSLGAALGRMHIHTYTREDGFETLRRRLWMKNKVRSESLEARDRGIVNAIRFGMNAFEGSGIAVPDSVRSFADNAARRIEKGTHRAFTPFDLAPDNILMSDRVQFLDYEWAGYRDVLFDVASVVAGFPLHVFVERPSDEEVDVFVRAWFEEIRDQWYRSTDERRLTAFIAAALVGWLFISATVNYFGSPTEALWVDHESRTDLDPKIGGSQLARHDMANTARAIARFALKCDDERADELVAFAGTAIDFLEAEGE